MLVKPEMNECHVRARLIRKDPLSTIWYIMELVLLTLTC